VQDRERKRQRRDGEVALATLADLRGELRARQAALDDPRRPIVREIVARLAGEPGPLLPILHDVQHALGCIPSEVVADIADGLNLSRAEVHGVVSYYHHFRSTAPGRHVLEICRAESCQAMGGEALWSQACAALGLPVEGGTTADGSVTLQPVYCLGLCAVSPGAMLDEQPHARLTPQRLDALLERVRAKEPA
jgi:formate dehydrogenase subunit gamma